jgi:phosphoglycerate dehydrogenase-like enzyme
VTPWVVGLLSPADDDDTRQVFGDLPFEIRRPVTRDAAGVSGLLSDVDILVSDWSGVLVPTGADFTAAPFLCFVQKPGSGVDDHDVAALTRAGIPIANTAGITAPSMAEWCLGAAISLVRRIHDADQWMRAGEWPQLQLADRGAVELASLNVGVVGFGPVAKLTAERFASLGCHVAYWSRRRRDPSESAGIPWLELDDLMARTDLLVVAIALTDDTRNLIDRRRLEMLPPGAFVVNVARGTVLDEAALIDGLANGRIAGAALDVFQSEPLPADSLLRTFERVILSPHSSANTPQSRERLLAALNENLTRVASGDPVHWVVNGISPSLVRRR